MYCFPFSSSSIVFICQIWWAIDKSLLLSHADFLYLLTTMSFNYFLVLAGNPNSAVSVWSSILLFHWREVENLKKPFMPPREVHVQVTHSMPPQKIEIFKSMEDWAENNILVHLKPVEKCWQPQDFLPDPASDGFDEQVKELRERAKELPDDYFVVLVGDMITEEALPTYQTMLNTLDGVRDETGASLTSWAIWTRAWTAEENRHGDLLNKYLYLSGRVDMRQIEKTIQYLIGSGMVSSLPTKLAALFWTSDRKSL